MLLYLWVKYVVYGDILGIKYVQKSMTFCVKASEYQELWMTGIEALHGGARQRGQRGKKCVGAALRSGQDDSSRQFNYFWIGVRGTLQRGEEVVRLEGCLGGGHVFLVLPVPVRQRAVLHPYFPVQPQDHREGEART